MQTRHPQACLGAVTLVAAVTLAALLPIRPSGSLADGDRLAALVAWLIAIAASGWLALSGATCLTATVTHRRAPQFAPLSLRRLVEVVLVSGAVALPALPAHAAGPPSPARDQPIVRAADPFVLPAPSTLPPSKLAAPKPAAPRTTPPPTAPKPSPVWSRTHVVEPGDNLWLIARGTLAAASSRRPSDAQLITYWHAVIASNRGSLRSGDPSLIFPGEIVTLPPLPSLP